MEPTGNPEVHRAIVELLNSRGVAFREARHGPTRTSMEAAEARGEPLAIGGKALVIRVDGVFRLFVLSAARKLDNRAIKGRFGTHDTRFATPEELGEMAGLVPGCVPPFGRPILPVDLFLDSSILANDRIAFNAGMLTVSMILDRAAYVEVARPTEVFTFSLEGEAP